MTKATQELYEKLRAGDRLSDAEVLEGFKFFDKLSNDLLQAGRCFRIMAKEAQSVSDVLRGYLDARNLSL